MRGLGRRFTVVSVATASGATALGFGVVAGGVVIAGGRRPRIGGWLHGVRRRGTLSQRRGEANLVGPHRMFSPWAQLGSVAAVVVASLVVAPSAGAATVGGTVARAASVALPAPSVAVPAPPVAVFSCDAGPGEIQAGYGPQVYQVPVGVAAVTLIVNGATGAGSQIGYSGFKATAGGVGAQVEATVAVRAGTILAVTPGCASTPAAFDDGGLGFSAGGSGGSQTVSANAFGDGGGGGGSSAVTDDSGQVFAAAGGGGGVGGDSAASGLAAGGDGSRDGQPGTSGHGTGHAGHGRPGRSGPTGANGQGSVAGGGGGGGGGGYPNGGSAGRGGSCFGCGGGGGAGGASYVAPGASNVSYISGGAPIGNGSVIVVPLLAGLTPPTVTAASCNGTQIFTSPTGVDQLIVAVAGSSGADSGTVHGGAGALVQGSIPTQAGDRYLLSPGCSGFDGSSGYGAGGAGGLGQAGQLPGGAGGGASALSFNGAPLIVAGAGGGAGGTGTSAGGAGGAGSAAGDTGATSGDHRSGGAGGNQAGAAGAAGYTGPDCSEDLDGSGGGGGGGGGWNGGDGGRTGGCTGDAGGGGGGGSSYTASGVATPTIADGGGPTGDGMIVIEAVPAPLRPGAPIIGQATAGNGQATVVFTPPASDGGAPITAYTIIATDLTKSARGGQTAVVTSSPAVISGLTNGDVYTVTMTATNAAGTSRISSRSNTFTPSAQAATAYSFVANLFGNSITEYARGDSGDAIPVATISGPATGLSQPDGLAVSRTGELFVSNGAVNSVTEYAPGATGNATPVATIAGPATGLSDPSGVAVDPSGDLYVANDQLRTVTEYAPGATGNATPIATISGPATGLLSPQGLALNAAGDLLVANYGANSVTEYGPGATGNTAPIARISGAATGLSSPFGVAVNAAGQVLVTNAATNTLDEFSAGATGNTAPIATISGPGTGLTDPAAVAVDASGNAFVSNLDGTVTQYGPGAHGNAQPATDLTGPDTGINDPVAVAVYPLPSAPGVPTAVTATGTSFGAIVSFTPPADGGGSPSTYTVVASPGGETVTGVGSPLALTGLASGVSYTFTVYATNATGSSPRSAPAGPVTIGSVPSPPLYPSATVHGNQATVSFLPPLDTGGSPTTGYTVTSSPGGLTAQGTSTSLTVGGLTYGVTYTFTVTAQNATGTSQPSPTSNAVTPVAPPAPANDNFASAQAISGASGTVNGTTVGATLEPGEPVPGDGAGASVWYQWTAPAGGGSVTFDTCISDFATTVTAYDGSTLATLQPVPTATVGVPGGCAAGDSIAEFDFPNIPGTTIYLSVDGQGTPTGPSEGTFTLGWQTSD